MIVYFVGGIRIELISIIDNKKNYSLAIEI